MLGCIGGAFRVYLLTCVLVAIEEPKAILGDLWLERPKSCGWGVMEEPNTIFGDLWLELLESCGLGVIEEPPGYIWCPVVGL